MNSQPMAGKGSRNIDDLPFPPVENSTVSSLPEGESPGAAIQLHPLQEIRESEDLQPAA